jgi:hypothetical protein
VFSLKHSLHRNPTDAPAFYGVCLALITLAAALVLIPGTPLGLLTNAVQVLAGILLPSATVFLLLLSNDKPVLGPWANTARVNIFTGAVIAVLVALSVMLTASTLFAGFGATQILCTLGIGLAGVNGLSEPAKQYFAAGGLGILVGDGALSYAGERILERYYRVGVTKHFALTLDYQYITNPAYNNARGPVSVYGLRCHAQL